MEDMELDDKVVQEKSENLKMKKKKKKKKILLKKKKKIHWKKKSVEAV